MSRPRVLLLTNLFPNPGEPEKAVFNRQMAVALAGRMPVMIMAPVPFFPRLRILSGLFPGYGRYSEVPGREVLDNLEIRHPPYLVIPKVFRSLYALLYALSIFPRLLRFKRTYDFQCLVCSYAYPDGVAGIGMAHLLGIPVVVKVHGCDINLLTRKRLLRAQIRFAFRRASGIIAVSEPLKERLIDIGVPARKIIVIPNGIDPSRFKPMDKKTCRLRLGLPPHRRIILFIGSLEEVKGVTYLARAFEELVKTQDPPLLVMGGEGSLAKNLNGYFQQRGLMEHVRFLGRVSHETVPSLMNACDLFCLPSLREGCPNVILEALACGKYIVASRVGGIPPLITSEAQGILVLPADSRALVQALKLGLEKSQDALPFSPAGRTWDDVAGETADFIQKAMGDSV